MNYKHEIDSRMVRIIDVLGAESSYISLKDLAKNLNLSRRQVEHDILRINYLFDSLDLDLIQTKENKGVRLVKKNLLWFGQVFNNKEHNIRFVFSKDERVALIIIHTIIGGSLYTYNDLCEHLDVSRTTIFSDMKEARKIIEETGATLQYDYYYKYYIKATGLQYSRLLNFAGNILFANIPKRIIEVLISPKIFGEISKLYETI